MAAPTIAPTSTLNDTMPEAGGSRSGLRNQLLSLLPQSELDTILGQAEDVTVRSKEVLFRRGEAIRHVYFPDNCVISLVTELENGDAVEGAKDSRGSRSFTG